MNRFRNLFPDDDVNILKHAEKIVIEVAQIDGFLAMEFKIEGTVFSMRDEEDEPNCFEQSANEFRARRGLPELPPPPDPADLAKKLLGAFVAAKAGKGGKS